tara:strand:+ start:997 stop:1401 length:405 start_codon:yes stop_codon:yes gene_type:complete
MKMYQGNQLQNQEIRTSIKDDIKDAIETVFVLGSILILGIVFLCVSGCSSKNINMPLEPTTKVIETPKKITTIKQARSRNVQLAINKAKHMARTELADYLQTNTLKKSRVETQQLETDKSGVVYIATIKMTIDK